MIIVALIFLLLSLLFVLMSLGGCIFTNTLEEVIEFGLFKSLEVSKLHIPIFSILIIFIILLIYYLIVSEEIGYKSSLIKLPFFKFYSHYRMIPETYELNFTGPIKTCQTDKDIRYVYIRFSLFGNAMYLLLFLSNKIRTVFGNFDNKPNMESYRRYYESVSEDIQKKKDKYDKQN